MEDQQNGVAVYGTDAVIHIGRWARRWRYKLFDKAGKLVQYYNPGAEGHSDPEGHQKNFLDCIRSRKLPNADIGIGHMSAIHCHLANIVARTGRNVRFDPGTETIIGDPEANLFVKRMYRTHWGTPTLL